MPELIHTLIFVTVWPEPQSSAAGVRIVQWIQFLLGQGHRITVISSAAKKSEEDWGYLDPNSDSWCQRVSFLQISLNRSENAQVLKDLNPQLVLFDRFILEEQFGHWIYEQCPNALVWLETQDLHFLRKYREISLNEPLNSGDPIQIGPVTVQSLRKRGDGAHSIALRELASIRRVDRTFVVSSFERRLLIEQFGVLPEEVHWLPFTYDPPLYRQHWPGSKEDSKEVFLKSSGFSWIGNFRHPPNPDGLIWFVKNGWAKVRNAIPNATLTIFGAYPSAEIMKLNSPKNGVVVKGSVNSLEEVFCPKDRIPPRVNLAPLRFGAGIKGKILEGFRFGVPAVCTSIGWEGLFPESATSPLGANHVEDFASQATALHEDFDLWNEARRKGFDLLAQVHSYAAQKGEWEKLLHDDFKWKQDGRLPRFWSEVARRESWKGSRYFSKWIELKEQTKSDRS